MILLSVVLHYSFTLSCPMAPFPPRYCLPLLSLSFVVGVTRIASLSFFLLVMGCLPSFLDRSSGFHRIVHLACIFCYTCCLLPFFSRRFRLGAWHHFWETLWITINKSKATPTKNTNNKNKIHNDHWTLET
ncbi:MAG: hypothetical protein JOS17DRAFT_62453 [Linnemannia elongata]|nr:MAG: hypothetical protein JOS17DRAFT_62453 [Linnemannia elongata]